MPNDFYRRRAVSPLKIKIPGKNMRQKVAMHHVTRQNKSIHDILSIAPQLSISHKTLGTLPEDGNVMPKHVEDTIYN
jgi:hypothetical protein